MNRCCGCGLVAVGKRYICELTLCQECVEATSTRFIEATRWEGLLGMLSHLDPERSDR